MKDTQDKHDKQKTHKKKKTYFDTKKRIGIHKAQKT